MKRFISLILLGSFCLCMLSGCDLFRQKYTDYYFDAFDTVTIIVGFEKDKQTFDQNCDRIKQKLIEYHQLYTIYDEFEGKINLKTVNEEAAKSPVKVESPITELLLFSVRAYELTGGKINIAMGSVLSVWHEYRQKAQDGISELPDMKLLKEASKHTNIYDILIDSEEGTVFFTDPELKIDVGAVAKGYAAQKICEWMISEGMKDYSIAIGGNVCTIGDREWTVGIENPNAEQESDPYLETLNIKNASLVTSGSYQRFYTVDGKDYHHIIDGETLMPSDRFISVSVVCNDSAMADALSTALFCMDYEKGLEIIEAMDNTEAFWLCNDGKKLYSSGFLEYCN